MCYYIHNGFVENKMEKKTPVPTRRRHWGRKGKKVKEKISRFLERLKGRPDYRDPNWWDAEMREPHHSRDFDHEPTGKPVSTVGCLAMVGYWLAVWFFGPGWLTLVYLGMTMSTISLIARFKRTSFKSLLKNNNWVFLATLGMFITSLVMAYQNPMVPQGIGGWLWNLLGGEAPLANSTLWGLFNQFFFGSPWTHGWTDAAITYFLFLFPATAVSFWDEAKHVWTELWEKGSNHKEGWVKFLAKDGVAEIFWALPKIVLKGFFGGHMFSLLILASALTFSSCGTFKSPLEKEFTKLSAVEPAGSAAEAEKLYAEVEKFATLLGQGGPAVPDGLLEKARALQQKRAREFAKAAARDWSLGSLSKVVRALTGAGLNPSAEASAAGIDPGKLPPKVDPTADMVPPEWRHSGKEGK